MAYVRFEPPADSLNASEISRVLGPDEWSVVEIARNDGLWSLHPDGFLQRLLRTLFGIQPPRPLANERLEALRRYAVIAWNKGRVGAAQMREFTGAGFSRAAAREVLGHIQRWRQAQSRTRGIA